MKDICCDTCLFIDFALVGTDEEHDETYEEPFCSLAPEEGLIDDATLPIDCDGYEEDPDRIEEE